MKILPSRCVAAGSGKFCSHSFQYFTLIFVRHYYEGPGVHMSFLKYISNGNSPLVTCDAVQLLPLAPPTSLCSTQLAAVFDTVAPVF